MASNSIMSEKKIRKEKEILLEFDLNSKDLRTQLNEQLKCLDLKVETEFAILSEIQDFFKKRSELEMEYSRSLDKMVRNIQLRHRNEKSKRDHWHLYTPYACWQNLLQRCKEESKDHSAISDLYLAVITPRISQIIEDNLRIHKRCKEIGLKCHEEIFKVLNELNTAMKSYHLYNTSFKISEQKLKMAETQMNKLEIKDKISTAKKKIITKTGKRQEKFMANKLKLDRSRNEYLLSLAAANTTIYRYFQEDVNDLIDCSTVGFLPSLSGTLQLYLQGEDKLLNSRQEGMRDTLKAINDLDSKSDKQRFLELYNNPFQLPNKIGFRHHRGDSVGSFSAVPEFAEELNTRHAQLTSRLASLRIENDEIWKTLETAEASLLAIIWAACQYNVGSLFDNNSYNSGNSVYPSHIQPSDEGFRSGAGVTSAVAAISGGATHSVHANGIKSSFSAASNLASLSSIEASDLLASSDITSIIKNKTDRQDVEEFYIKKFKEYLLTGDLIARLQAKFLMIHSALQELHKLSGGSGNFEKFTLLTTSLIPSAHGKTPKKKRVIGQAGKVIPAGQRPKLFGGSLEEYLTATGQDIPLIMLSTIRVINLYGLHHQGIFRVSGSQLEINEFKNAFERGEDPLVDIKDSRDMNSVAGVLKLYFRELREPLFPICMFDQLVALGSKIASSSGSKTITYPSPSADYLYELRDLIATLARPVYLTTRYLFAFLHHLSQFSDENMMDPYNLAVCFGPTLLPVPADRDQVQCQAGVNELIRVIIMCQQKIFPVNKLSYASQISKATTGGKASGDSDIILGAPGDKEVGSGDKEDIEDNEEEIIKAIGGSNNYYRNEGPFYDEFCRYPVQGENNPTDLDYLEDLDLVDKQELKKEASLERTEDELEIARDKRLLDDTDLKLGARESFSISEDNSSDESPPRSPSHEDVNDISEEEGNRKKSSFIGEGRRRRSSFSFLGTSTANSCIAAADISENHKDGVDILSKDDSTGRHNSASQLAVARFNFKARNSSEISFEKGDILRPLYKISPDWWKVSLVKTGNKTDIIKKEGLAPHRFLSLVSVDTDTKIKRGETGEHRNTLTSSRVYKSRANSDTNVSNPPAPFPIQSIISIPAGPPKNAPPSPPLTLKQNPVKRPNKITKLGTSLKETLKSSKSLARYNDSSTLLAKKSDSFSSPSQRSTTLPYGQTDKHNHTLDTIKKHDKRNMVTEIAPALRGYYLSDSEYSNPTPNLTSRRITPHHSPPLLKSLYKSLKPASNYPFPEKRPFSPELGFKKQVKPVGDYWLPYDGSSDSPPVIRDIDDDEIQEFSNIETRLNDPTSALSSKLRTTTAYLDYRHRIDNTDSTSRNASDFSNSETQIFDINDYKGDANINKVDIHKINHRLSSSPLFADTRHKPDNFNVLLSGFPDLVSDLPRKMGQENLPSPKAKPRDKHNLNSEDTTSYYNIKANSNKERYGLQSDKEFSSSDPSLIDDSLPPPVTQIIKGFERKVDFGDNSSSIGSLPLIKPALRIKPAFLQKSSPFCLDLEPRPGSKSDYDKKRQNQQRN
ncbi:unnamed protein product [Gordionus sp. m RMFG-2023]|uniref:uncharacterized protein LOC135922898 n=1 Tax=Gordionus sp. m RMFG-2023 TaxID=3053472 RepID=UPI0030DECE28